MNIHAMNLRRVHRRDTHDIVALDDVSLDVHPGEFVTVTGPSGSGKSTLLHLLGLIDNPTAGTLRIDDVDTASLSDDQRSEFRRRTFGFVFQSFLLLPGLAAWENVALAELLDGKSLRTQRARALALLDDVGLADRSDHPPHELSGGEQQRVAIARSLMTDPEVVFADEPTGALDQANSASILALLKGLTIDRRRSLVVVTHEPAIATSAGARIISLRDGRVADDPVPT
ncbi:ABC transporter ATP-binding protein [Candidatus Poriferisodalis sp.]|uniref:ABC transporter ATP-binding protein n=1 Tax=Candidatus Poriferisodalis sp. TaxID=3101277 RepID=UPI003AF6F9BB